jgi:subtilisin family serine protease
MTTKKSKSKKAASKAKAAKVPILTSKPSKDPLPTRIFANASPRSIGGVSMFEGQSQIKSETVGNFFSEGEVVEAAVARLNEAGFEILQISPLSINFAGTPAQFRRTFKTDIVVEDRPVIKGGAQADVAQFLDSPDTALSGLVQTEGTNMADAIEGVALEEPRYPMAASMFAPLKSYWHLRVPGDVSLACNADRAHRAGITGKGIKVAMVDSGWFKHPYFVGRGYKAAPVVLGPGAANPLADESGHGTGESANIFANAPDIDFMPVKINFVNSTGGFNAAVGLHPHIITCSWGSHHPVGPLSAADQVLAAAISAAVASGIIVVFSAGNGHYGFPGMHPDVISAGGVFMNSDESLQASNYASSYPGNVYPGRACPDLCGLVGMKPKAIYITLPIQPGDQIDSTPWNAPPPASGLQGGTFPNGDETTNNDGWGAFSGTSAAAPQLAGVAALIKQACPGLTPAQVRNIMKNTARDVTAGSSNAVQGTPIFPAAYTAAAGVDIATGSGLVDAHKAVMVAKVTCLGPILPPITTPIITTPVVTPPVVLPPIVTPPVITPPVVTPPIVTGPVLPPISPPIVVQPIKPGPITPIEPVKPIAPIVNPGPVIANPTPAAGEAGGEAAGGQTALSADDVQTLSDLIIGSDPNE